MKKEFNAASRDWMFTYDNTFQVQRRFTHVLTTSALDIGGGATTLTNTQYYAKYVGETPPSSPYNTPFNNFTTAYNNPPLIMQGDLNPSTNQPAWQFTSNGSEYHTRFYLRNANWLAAELNGTTTVRTNCSAYCSSTSITGNPIICNSETYSVPFVSGATYIWTVGNTLLVTPTINGNTIVLTKNGAVSGETTLSVTISGSCGNINLGPITIKVGGPRIDFITFANGFNGEGYFCTSHMGNQFEYLLSYIPENSSIEYRILNWPALNVVYTSPIQYPANGMPITVEYIPSPGWYVLEARTTSSCGSTEWVGFEVEYVDCSTMGNNEYFRIQASPNPTSSDLYVSIDQ